MNAPNQLATMKSESSAIVQDNTRFDVFSARGFALAQRVATAFASSDSVPAQFRLVNTKKVNGQEQLVENPAAIGNCLVAMEVAQAVGISTTATMQNADVIEGKLRWSDRFVVACVNSSRRFTPLRFDVKNLGVIEASYKEKTGWDNQARRPIFTDRTVKVENLRSIAWALPFGMSTPPGIYTLDQARAAGLPVVEGPPVSMKLAVEEGWYGKAGSKWQTELKHKMLMMRSGRYFGDIHAPDIVMGFGRTSEEESEIIDVVQQPDGAFAPVNVNRLKPEATANVDTDTGEIRDEQDEALRQLEQKTPQTVQQTVEQPDPAGEWRPDPEEEAAIRAQEMAEASGQQSAPRGRRERPAMNIE